MAPRIPSKLSHSLRITVLFLRLALGLNFFYFGFAVLFNPSLASAFRAQSFSNLYSWLATPALPGDWMHPAAQWAFLIVGACLIIGLATRLASIAGIAATLLSFLPTVSYTAFSIMQFINDEVIIVLCLLILILANAGVYFGLDRFIHISFRGKPREAV